MKRLISLVSRKIVGWAVHREESSHEAAALFLAACAAEHVAAHGIVLHADNGSPMKGATMLCTLQRLGVLPSFSRPGVSNDNAFSEALFRTLKYVPAYPRQPFADLAAARAWVSAFVAWYNTQHLHSAIRFVTPAERHAGGDTARLQARARVYDRAQQRTPLRWSGRTRDWTPIAAVHLNPDRDVVVAVPAGIT